MQHIDRRRALLLGLASGAALAVRGTHAAEPASDWTQASPDDAGFDAAMLEGLRGYVVSGEANIHAVVIARQGRLVFEAYGSGPDLRWGDDLGVVTYDETMAHDVRSVTKSVVSLLVGIAQDRGLFPDVSTPIMTLLPEYRALSSPDLDRVTVSHLLTMASGLEWNEDLPLDHPGNSEQLMFAADDPYRFVLTRPFAAVPGALWTYSSGSTTLLAKALTHTTSGRLEDFAADALFAPLGIADAEWMQMTNGDPIAGGGLRLRPRDMAKLGQLLIDGGAWRGLQVVPAAWIEASTMAAYSAWEGMWYARHWWRGSAKVGGKVVPWIGAIGFGGQRIYAFPDLELVFAMTAGRYRSSVQLYEMKLLLQRVLATLS